MYEIEIMLLLFVLLFVGNIAMLAFWIWGILSIENAIRDDLQRYHSELTMEQITKALEFQRGLKKK